VEEKKPIGLRLKRSSFGEFRRSRVSEKEKDRDLQKKKGRKTLPFEKKNAFPTNANTE